METIAPVRSGFAPREMTREESLAAYADYGLAGVPAHGRPVSDRHMLAFPHDGVQYCLSHYGKEEHIERCVRNLRLTIERHYALVKRVFEHFQARSSKPIWAMCVGGQQLQVFFGDDEGYIAILYLTMVDPAEEQRRIELGSLAPDWREGLLLVLEACKQSEWPDPKKIDKVTALTADWAIPEVRVRFYDEA